MKEKEYLYHKLKRITDNRVKGESKSLDQYIELYTQIVKEISENLKNKKEMINNLIVNESNSNKTLDFKEHFKYF